MSVSLRFLFLTIIALMPGIRLAHAQYAASDFAYYTVREGLSNNDIRCIQQDHMGFIWIGTKYGLNRYDGSSFRPYHHELPDDFLRSSSINELIRIDSFHLGIISRGGFQVMDTRNGLVLDYVVPDSTVLSNYRNSAWTIASTRDGGYIVTTATGMYVFDARGLLTFRHDAFGPEDMSTQRILFGREIFSIGGDQYIVYAEERSTWWYDHRTKIFRELTTEDKSLQPFAHPSDGEGGRWLLRHQLSRQEFLFAQRGEGLTYYNHANGLKVRSQVPDIVDAEMAWDSRIHQVNDSTYLMSGGRLGFFIFHLDRPSGKITFQMQKFMDTHKVRNFFIDREHRLWLATSTGLLRQIMLPEAIRRYSWFDDGVGNLGFADGLIHHNILFIGRFDRKDGVIAIDAETMQLKERYTFYGEGSPWNEVYSIAMYHPDTLWVGTHEGLLWLDTRTHTYDTMDMGQWGVTHPDMINILAPARHDSTAWMLGWLTGPVIRYDLRSRKTTIFSLSSDPPLPFSKVKHIVYDAFGDVWIGGHALARWNQHTMRFDTMISTYAGPGKFNDDIVTMSSDTKGSLWLYNAYNTLLKYKVREQQFEIYGPSQGMPRMMIESMSPAYRDILFVQGSNQVARINTNNGEIRIVADEHDLPEFLSLNRRMILDPARNRTLALYKNEVITLPMSDEPQFNLSGGIIIHELVINNQQHLAFPPGGIKLKSTENDLSIHFTVLDFEKGDQYLFSYKLNDEDQWTPPARHRSINLTNVSPGPYSIQVKAIGNSGETIQTTFDYTIQTPVWRRPWFFLILTVLVAGTAWLLFRNHIARIRHKADLDQLIARTELKALHAQMNPHFIFNSLNSIREMILNNDNANASRYLSKFAHLIRSTLDHSRQPLITLRQTADYLNRYIEMEKIRSAHFEFTLTVDPALDQDELYLPPMIIQPFVENAIWHGKDSRKKILHIDVSFTLTQDKLVSIIEDDGMGIEHSLRKKGNGSGPHQSVGITNIRERITVLNKKHAMECDIAIDDKSLIPGEGSGTKVTVTFPLEFSVP